MNSGPLKSFLSSFFATVLKVLAGAAVAHRLVSPDAATGLLSYADPLAAGALLLFGQAITWTKTAQFKSDIAHLKAELFHQKITSIPITSIQIPPEK